MIPVSWPFAQWGLDMVGPLTKSAHGGDTYLLVAVDKFTLQVVLLVYSKCPENESKQEKLKERKA